MKRWSINQPLKQGNLDQKRVVVWFEFQWVFDKRLGTIGSETVCGMDAAVEPPWMGSRRVEETIVPSRATKGIGEIQTRPLPGKGTGNG